MNKDTLRKVRKAAGYSQARMGLLLGYSESHYRNMELGYSSIPDHMDGPFLLLKISKHHKDVMKTSEVLVGF